jgi:hypothetical protein
MGGIKAYLVAVFCTNEEMMLICPHGEEKQLISLLHDNACRIIQQPSSPALILYSLSNLPMVIVFPKYNLLLERKWVDSMMGLSNHTWQCDFSLEIQIPISTLDVIGWYKPGLFPLTLQSPGSAELIIANTYICIVIYSLQNLLTPAFSLCWLVIMISVLLRLRKFRWISAGHIS